MFLHRVPASRLDLGRGKLLVLEAHLDLDLALLLTLIQAPV
jgi:hypothetical protein